VNTPGVYGARFSGAGFRGSCLALVDPRQFEAVGDRVRQAYLDAFPQYAGSFGFYRCASGSGAHVTDEGVGSAA
jgi:galactokinase/galacturonokinase